MFFEVMRSMKKAFNMPRASMMMTSLVMVALCMLLCLFSCSSHPGQTYAVFSYGDVKVHGETLKAPYEISADTSISCGDQSLVVVQTGRHVKLLTHSNTSLRYAVRTEEGNIEIALENGTLVAEILRRGARVQVSAGDITLTSSKGSFDITKSGDACAVNVYEGNVTVAGIKDNKELKAGERVEMISNEMFVRTLTTQERRMGVLIKKVPVADDSTFERGSVEAVRVSLPVLMELLAVDSKNLSETLSMAALARKEGPLSVVTTRGGRRITGHLKARGKFVDIATSNGTITLPQKDIRTVSPYNAMR